MSVAVLQTAMHEQEWRVGTNLLLHFLNVGILKTDSPDAINRGPVRVHCHAGQMLVVHCTGVQRTPPPPYLNTLQVLTMEGAMRYLCKMTGSLHTAEWDVVPSVQKAFVDRRIARSARRVSQGQRNHQSFFTSFKDTGQVQCISEKDEVPNVHYLACLTIFVSAVSIYLVRSVDKSQQSLVNVSGSLTVYSACL
jgi:hypothetical protein